MYVLICVCVCVRACVWCVCVSVCYKMSMQTCCGRQFCCRAVGSALISRGVKCFAVSRDIINLFIRAKETAKDANEYSTI